VTIGKPGADCIGCYVLTGADHGDLSFTGNTTAAKPWSTQETMNHIVDFLGQHLRG
jgi:hypothetical protein